MEDTWDVINEEELNRVASELFRMTESEGYDEVRIVHDGDTEGREVYQVEFFKEGDLMAAHNLTKYVKEK